MKSILTAVLVMLTIMVNAQPTPQSADVIMKDAYQQAARENKNVIVMFHASWCIWCHKMDSSLLDPSCRKFFNDNYVIKHIVVAESKDKKSLETPGGEEMRVKYKAEEQGIPFWLILDKNGKLLADSKIRPEGAGFDTEGDNAGCPASETEVSYFLRVLKASSRLTDEQLEVIRKRFRQNE